MPPEPHPFSRAAEELIAALRRAPGEKAARMRKRPTREISALVEELRVKHRIGRSSPEETVLERWPELVGAANAAYSHPVRIEAGRRLVVHATHAVVRNELFLHRAEIVARARALPGCADLKELRVRAG